eukprot:1196229-Prorocentrum_minimum.AAC.1
MALRCTLELPSIPGLASHCAFVLRGGRAQGGQAGDGGHVSHEREEEAGADGGADVPDGQDKVGGGALGGGVVRERVLRLRHADGQLREPLPRVQRDLLLLGVKWGVRGGS